MDKRNYLFKLLSAFGFSLLCYPIVCIVCAGFTISYPQQFIILAATELSFMLVFFISSYINDYAKKHQSCSAMVGYLLTIALSAGLFFLAPLLSLNQYILSVAVLLFGFLAVHFHRHSYNEIFTKNQLRAQYAVSGCMYIAVWILSHSHVVYYSFIINGIVLIASTIVSWLIKNRESLADSTTNLHYSVESLPKMIFRYNAKLVAIVSAVVFVVAGISLGVGHSIDTAISNFVYRIENIQLSDTPEVFSMGDVDSSAYAESDMLIPPTPSNVDYVMRIVINVIITIVAAFLVGCLIYFNINHLPRALRDAIERFLSRFRRKGDMLLEDSAYTDIVQSSYGYAYTTSVGFRKSKKDFKHSYKQYLNMPQSIEKYRFGYKLAQNGISISGIGIYKSDTPNETVKKASVLEIPDYSPATEGYNLVRYANQGYTPESIAALDSALTEISKNVAKKKRPDTPIFKSE